MKVCIVIGQAVSTVKDPRLVGYKLLVCREHTGTGPATASFLAVDAIGAGEGDLVAVTTGAPAMMAAKDAPVDAVVIAILDEVRADGLVLEGRSLAGGDG